MPRTSPEPSTSIAGPAPIVPVVGDITFAHHRDDLATAAASLGGLDLLVLNAGTLGPSPLPAVTELDLDDLRVTLETNVVAQVGLLQALLPQLRPGAAVVAVTSDAAVEAYEGWGAYAASKAAFEEVAAVLGAERPDLRGPAGRPRRHADTDAPGRLPRRGHLRPPAPRGQRGRTAPPGRGAPPQRSLSRGRRPDAAGGGLMTTVTVPDRVLDVHVPDELLADHPVEAEGRRRDDVRMLVASRSRGVVAHARAADLPTFLEPGDVLVVNTSATLPAAVATQTVSLIVHLSTDLGGGRWVVEVREPVDRGSRPHLVREPRSLALRGGARLRLLVPHSPLGARGARLWRAELTTPAPVGDWLAAVGRPIRYGSTETAWPHRGLPDAVRRTDPVAHRPRQRRDALGRPAVHPRAGERADRRRGRASPRSPCTPACRRWKRTSRPTPSATRCRRRPQSW